MNNLTKSALASSLIRLLEERPLDKITVKEITAECGVTRNTFYYHFRDIYDLLSWIFDTQADNILREYESSRDWEDAFAQMLDYLYQRRKMIYHVYKSMSRDELELYLSRVAGRYAFRIVEIQTADMEVEDKVRAIVSDFYKNAFVGATLQWINDGMKTPVEDMALLYDGVFKGTIKEAVVSVDKVIK